MKAESYARLKDITFTESVGYSTSPTIAAVSTSLLISFLALALFPETQFVFSTVSNLAYIFAGFWRELHAVTESHSATVLVGQLGAGSFFLVFLGAASFAYHSTTQSATPAHTLDIVGGWLLVAHLLYVSFSVTFLALIEIALPSNYDFVGWHVARGLLSAVFLAFVTLLFLFYDFFYAHQTEFFFILGPSSAVFAGGFRFYLAREKKRCNLRATAIAVFEICAMLLVVSAAIMCQGELIPPFLDKYDQTEGPKYDLYHGHWHFFLAVSSCLIYSRAADVARVVKKTHYICVCRLPTLDFLGTIWLAVYATTAGIMKQVNVVDRARKAL